MLYKINRTIASHIGKLDEKQFTSLSSKKYFDDKSGKEYC
jgi:hypothetical protein